jgi:hypothetical protein
MNDAPAFGVALSGGGHRATAFGLGALLYLSDSGLSHQVRTISSVSGGSLLNAFLGIQETPFHTCPATDFERRAAQLAQLLSGNVTRWEIIVRSAILVFLFLIGSWMLRDTLLVLCVALVLFSTLGVTLGPRCGGTLFSHWLTWLYLAALSFGIFVILACMAERRGIVDWGNSIRGASTLATSLKLPALGSVLWGALLCMLILSWWALAQQRHVIAGIAFGNALARIPGSRGGPRVTLDVMHGQGIRHVLCATELHAGQHAFFSRDLVYSRGFGIGGPGTLTLRAAVQLSANFPGGFPPRIMRASRFRFELSDPDVLFRDPTEELLSPAHSVPRWMVLSDGGVFDNTADSWFLDAGERREHLDIQFNKLVGDSLGAWVQEDKTRANRLRYDEPEYTDEFREPFNAQHRVLIERLSAVREVPERLVIVNAGKPEPWQSLWSVWIPLIGELTGFGKISSTMYNNTASRRLRDLRARFASGGPQGAVVDIEEDPFSA